MQKIKFDGRLETGVVQNGDDWPGLFIRGDDCAAFLGALKNPEEAKRFGAYNIPRLIELLEATRVKKAG